jgi:hypothetical protein
LLQGQEFDICRAPPGVEHKIPTDRDFGSDSDCFSNATTHSISVVSFAQGTRSGKSKTGRRVIAPMPTKGGKVRTGNAEAVVIYLAKFPWLQQLTVLAEVEFSHGISVLGLVRHVFALAVTDGAFVADGQFPATASAATGKHSLSVNGFHTRTEPMFFRAFAIVGLKRSLRHLCVPRLKILFWF